jgi:class 3 adenylate cyclase
MNSPEMKGVVAVSVLKDSTRVMSELTNSEAAIWLNGIYHQLTESMLKFGGLPVKYLGGGALFFFTGPDCEIRSIKAAVQAKKIMKEELSTGLHYGSVYYTNIGHKDYEAKDILGTDVNTAFRIAGLETNSGIKASMLLVQKAGYAYYRNAESVLLKGLSKKIEVCDIYDN